MSKNSTTITQFEASMMANGRFGQQIRRNKAFNSAAIGVEISKIVFKIGVNALIGVYTSKC